MNEWRLLNSPAAAPAENMAVDEALFRSLRFQAGAPTLRLYAWQPAGISLGVFQDAAATVDLEACARARIPVVRRMTGGEAIFHDTELTYSLVCRQADLNLPSSVKGAYFRICRFLIEFYRQVGVSATFSPHPLPRGTTPHSFCFACPRDFDLSVDGKKIGGNAQKRAGAVIFQHGSIPLRLDFPRISRFLRQEFLTHTGSIGSLADFVLRDYDDAALREQLAAAFVQTFSVSFSVFTLTDSERELAAKLQTEKYESGQWTRERIVPPEINGMSGR